MVQLRNTTSTPFVGVPDRIWSQRRLESSCQRLAESGFEPHVYQAPKRKRDREWGREHH